MQITIYFHNSYLYPFVILLQYNVKIFLKFMDGELPQSWDMWKYVCSLLFCLFG